MKRIVIIFLALFLAAARIAALPAVKIAVPAGTEAYIPLVTAIYAELGYGVEIGVLPAERAIQGVNSGAYDALLGAAGVRRDAFPNLLFGTEAIISTSVQAWVAKDSPLRISSPDDLKNHKVGLVRGGKLAEGFVASHGLAAEAVNDFGILERMLQYGRVEVALISSAAVPESFPRAFALAAPNLFSTEAYHVLNRKNAAVAPRFDAILRAMKADGRFKRYLPGQ